jgi:hypothetical protein
VVARDARPWRITQGRDIGFYSGPAPFDFLIRCGSSIAVSDVIATIGPTPGHKLPADLLAAYDLEKRLVAHIVLALGVARPKSIDPVICCSIG